MVKKIISFENITLLVIIFVHLIVLSRLFFFPYPELFIYSYLTSEGLVPYKQIFDQHFPGLMFFPVNFYTLGMKTPEVAQVWHLVVVAATHILIYLAAMKVIGTNKWRLLPNLLYLVWHPFLEGYVLWIDSFIPLFFLPAYYLFGSYEKGKERLLFYSGLFLGAALVFKQVTGILIVLLVLYQLLKWKNFKANLYFLSGVSIFTLFMLLYIVKIGAWNDFFFWTVKFNLTTFAKMGMKYPSLGQLVKISFVFAPALLAVVYFLKRKLSKEILLLSLFFLASLTFAYARFDFIHFQPALPFAVIIFSGLVKNLRKNILFIFAVFYIFGLVFLLKPFYRLALEKKVFLFGKYEEKLAHVVRRYANKGDSIFAFATTPHLYVITETLPPGKVFVFHFPWFMVEAEDKILSGIEKDPPRVVVKDGQANVEGLNLVSYMPKINNFVEENYKVVDNIDGTQILIPK